jgi:hypothetical protein
MQGSCLLVVILLKSWQSATESGTLGNDSTMTTVTTAGAATITPAGFEVASSPFHPPILEIVTRKVKVTVKGLVKVKTLHFLSNWFVKFPWLHYVPTLNGVLRYICASESAKDNLRLVTQKSYSFITDGFHNWSTATTSFPAHEKSACHRFALHVKTQSESSLPIDTALSEQTADEQATARKCLEKTVTTLQFLAGPPGLALQGKSNDSGNFYQLMKIRSADIKYLDMRLSRKVDMTSWATQNEIFELLIVSQLSDRYVTTFDMLNNLQ